MAEEQMVTRTSFFSWKWLMLSSRDLRRVDNGIWLAFCGVYCTMTLFVLSHVGGIVCTCHAESTRDVVIIGSGFGASPVALRLSEKGYDVLVLERGKRFRDEDFPKTNWHLSKYLWSPLFRLHGILEIDLFRNVLALHGCGVGGGSLVYGNVLVEPAETMYASDSWSRLADWKKLLAPHFATAKRMLGVTENPKLWAADDAMLQVARDLGVAGTFRRAPVGAYFGEPGKRVNDPYFGGAGPDRVGCDHCRRCMIGCRTGAKNTLVKNYLYLAERSGAEIRSCAEVFDIRPLPYGEKDGARYEIHYRDPTRLFGGANVVRTRIIIVAASTLGTLRLLLRCRDVTGSLPSISRILGMAVRTNSEALLGSTLRTITPENDKGIAITSYFQPDAVTTVEPVRFPAGSSSMRFLSLPVVSGGGGMLMRLIRIMKHVFTSPIDFARTHVLPRWAERTTIILVMQSVESNIRFQLGRSWLTFWRNDLVSSINSPAKKPGRVEIAHQVMNRFAEYTGGIRGESANEALADIPTTAHILGGVPFGASSADGVIGMDFQVHGYPGLYVCDGSVVPANPGFNPSLTIAALSELLASQFPNKRENKT